MSRARQPLPDASSRFNIRSQTAMRRVLVAGLLVTAVGLVEFKSAHAGPIFAEETRQQVPKAAWDQSLVRGQRGSVMGMSLDIPADETQGERVQTDPAASTNLAAGIDGRWIQEAPPGARSVHTAIYDPVRDRMVVFAGLDNRYFGDVWGLSLSASPTWSNLAATGTPPSPRGYHSAIYDPLRDRIVVFGGYDGVSAFNEVWALSLAGSPVWNKLTPAGTMPSPRLIHSAIYDPVRDRMVVFAGSSSGVRNDVWTFSLSGDPAWVQLAPTGTPPGPAGAHTAVYDPPRDRMVVFGGTNGTATDGLWALSLSGTPAWTQLAPGLAPAPRAYHSAIYDPLRDRMIVFGGTTTFGSAQRGDLWSLSLAGNPAWTELSPTGFLPSARQGHTAIYDPVRDRMIVFGGQISTSVRTNDVWAFALAGSPAWTQITPAMTQPAGRRGHAAVYDPVRDRMLVYGGYSTSWLSHTWALALIGTPAWTLIVPAGTPPFPREGHGEIYDPVRDRLVMFGGFGASASWNDSWVLSLSGTPTWTQLSPALPIPALRAWHSAIYDPVRDRMLVFGGSGSSVTNDVWALSLAGTPAWTKLTPSGTPPDARYGHSAIYDPVRDRMIVFGGRAWDGVSYTVRNDVWALSLAGSPAWVKLAPSGAPPAVRLHHSAVYDSQRNRMVTFGGDDLSNMFGDTWALSLTDSPGWTQCMPLGMPPMATGSHSAIYDPLRDRMLVFGGAITGGTALNEVWELVWAAAVGVEPSAPISTLSLAPAYPNPCQTDVVINFALPRDAAATLQVYDISGRLVRTLVHAPLSAGVQSARWDRRSSSGVLAKPGVYFYELRVDRQRLARKLVLIR